MWIMKRKYRALLLIFATTPPMTGWSRRANGFNWFHIEGRQLFIGMLHHHRARDCGLKSGLAALGFIIDLVSDKRSRNLCQIISGLLVCLAS